MGSLDNTAAKLMRLMAFFGNTTSTPFFSLSVKIDYVKLEALVYTIIQEYIL